MPVNTAKAYDNWTRFQYCRDRGHLDFINKADKCDAFFIGNQWKKDDLDALKDAKRPAITINKIMSTISTILGEQIYNRTEILFRPKNGSAPDTAEALTKMWMYISQENHLPWVRSDVFCDGVIRSRGFYDVRLKFNDSMQGELDISQLNSKNVVIDPDAEEYDPDMWADVYITKWMSGNDISVLYNEEDGKLLTERDNSEFIYGLDSVETVRNRFGDNSSTASNIEYGKSEGVRRNIRVLERQYRQLDKQLHFVDLSTGDMRPIPTDWDRDRISILLEKAGGAVSTTKKLVKRIRWCVTADDVLLHDDWSPYKHFTVVPYFPHFRYGQTVGIVENLLGPQEILNKVSSQELHIVNTTANSGWIVEAGSLVNMSVEELEQKGAQTGLVLEHAKGTPAPSKITPNQTPTGLDRISYKAEEHIKTISNVSDSQQGFDREDVAAKAIAYKRQASSVNMTKVLDNLERTDYILARNCLDIIQDSYTEPRIVNITHADVTHEAEELNVNQYDEATGQIVNDLTLGEYDITVTSSPYRASIEDSQFEQARALREIGVAIPDNVLIENSRLQRRSEIIKQITGDKESPEAQAQAALQQRGAEAEVAKVESEAAERHAKAQKTIQEVAQAANGQGDMSEQMRAENEFKLEMQKIENERLAAERDHLMKLDQMKQEMDLKRQAHDEDMARKREEHSEKIKQQREESVFRRSQEQQKSRQSEMSLQE